MKKSVRTNPNQYIGDELSLFSHAKNWKNYWGKWIRPYLGRRVLEVGAGQGGTVAFLTIGHSFDKWICLEPDPNLSNQILSRIGDPKIASKITVSTCSLSNFPNTEQFDSILYIDVLEHIEQDQPELQKARSFLKKGGHLIILVPAHNFLFSEFDKAIGHYRRYNKKTLKAVIPPELTLQKLIYLDSLGLCATLANKLILKQPNPTLKQILFWDQVIISVSKMTDALSLYCMGKSLLGIWKKI